MTKTTIKAPKLTMMTMTAAITMKMSIRKTKTPLVNMTLFFMTVTAKSQRYEFGPLNFLKCRQEVIGQF